MQINRSQPQAHPQRVALHNEVHARPPEAMSPPLAISHLVMLGDAGVREASRAHVAALLRDHHLPLPDAQSTHIRMDLGAFRIRWELHTEFVTWSFARSIEANGFGEREPATAIDAVPQNWLAELPGQCLVSLHLWVLPTQVFGATSLIKHVLNEDTLVASTVADGHGGEAGIRHPLSLARKSFGSASAACHEWVSAGRHHRLAASNFAKPSLRLFIRH